MMKDLGILLMRVTTGGLMAGHGAQKLFGWFGGHGLEGTSQWLESMNLRPGRRWAILAGLSEFGGGVLTAVGLLHPIGPIAMLGSMATAIAKVHWGKPIWVTSGGAELPVTNMSVGVGLALTGPGRFSLDRLLGIRVPGVIAILTLIVVAVLTVMSILPPAKPQQAAEAGAELQAEGDGARPEPA